MTADPFLSSAPVDVDVLAAREPEATRLAVQSAVALKVVQREDSLRENIRDPEAMRRLAARLRQHVLDHLDEYLELAEDRLTANGVQVHWAATAEDACAIVAGICERTRPADGRTRVIAKSKSMVSEEIRLNDFLDARGLHPIETDLGEFVVQIEHDHPTHIVAPIIHKSRYEVAKAFQREGLGPYSEDPEILTMQARRHLRDIFRRADIGITGANFVVAETGRLVICTNEGNGRMCTVAPRVHIAVTGIEKVLARETDLAVILKLLGRASTGQNLTVYTNFIAGPRREGDPDGPGEVHLVFLDNGRSGILGGRYHEMLRCIRCGACLNICPVYRQATGHGYRSVYPGPMGIVLSPLLERRRFENRYAALPKASSLCGACREACPVDIPIPEFILALRERFHGIAELARGRIPFGPWAILASHPLLWRAALASGKRFGWGPAQSLGLEAFDIWLKDRELPEWPEQSFRAWWKSREAKGNQSS